MTRKGGKVQLFPLGFEDLRDDVYLHVASERREPREFLLYPRARRTEPMEAGSSGVSSELASRRP